VGPSPLFSFFFFSPPVPALFFQTLDSQIIGFQIPPAFRFATCKEKILFFFSSFGVADFDILFQNAASLSLAVRFPSIFAHPMKLFFFLPFLCQGTKLVLS